MKFILVEDSEEIKKAIIHQLMAAYPAECEVSVVFNGKDAFNLITTSHFDILIIDLDIVGGSGMALFNKIINNRTLSKKNMVLFGSKPQISYLDSMDNIKYISRYAARYNISGAIESII